MYWIPLTSYHFSLLKNKKPPNHDWWTLNKSENFTPSPPQLEDLHHRRPKSTASSWHYPSRTLPPPAPNLHHHSQAGHCRHRPGWTTLPTPVLNHAATARVGTRCHSQAKPNAASPMWVWTLSALPRPENATNADAGPLRYRPCGTTLPPTRPDHSIGFFSIGLPPNLKSYSHSQWQNIMWMATF